MGTATDLVLRSTLVAKKCVPAEDLVVTVADEQTVDPGDRFLFCLDDTLLAIEFPRRAIFGESGKITSVPDTAKPGEVLP